MTELAYLIDAPVNVHSTQAEIVAWIAELKKLPGNDLGVRSAMVQARALLATVSKIE